MSVRIGKPSAFTPARIRSPSRKPGPRYAPALVRFALSKLALKTNSPTASRMPRAMRWTCSSLSITHGPAISTSALAEIRELNRHGRTRNWRTSGSSIADWRRSRCFSAAPMKLLNSGCGSIGLRS